MTAPRITAEYFDGRSARAQPVEVWLEGQDLHFGEQVVAQRGLRWPERQRHGQRQILLSGGAVLAFADGPAFDAWALASGRGESAVVRWQQSWRLTLASLVLLSLALAAGWRWGLPAAVQMAVEVLPPGIELSIGEKVLASFDDDWLKPTQLPRRQQQAIEARLAAALDGALDARAVQSPGRYAVHFRDGGKAIGANAFALPGGDLVITDALVQLLDDHPEAVVGVLAHELGHVQHRHALRMSLQAGAVGVVAGVILGDFSTLLAAAPALLASQAYSRDFEREADAYSLAVMRAGAIDPAVMVLFFERAAEARRKHEDGKNGKSGEGGADDSPIAIALASHPADAERIRFFSAR